MFRCGAVHAELCFSLFEFIANWNGCTKLTKWVHFGWINQNRIAFRKWRLFLFLTQHWFEWAKWSGFVFNMFALLSLCWLIATTRIKPDADILSVMAALALHTIAQRCECTTLLCHSKSNDFKNNNQALWTLILLIEFPIGIPHKFGLKNLRHFVHAHTWAVLLRNRLQIDNFFLFSDVGFVFAKRIIHAAHEFRDWIDYHRKSNSIIKM